MHKIKKNGNLYSWCKMGYMSRISKSFKHALVLPLAHESKYILFSDCHRGDGGAADNFQQNEFIYLAALRYYKCRGYTYLELGDGDELWESRSIEKIKEIHAHSFELLQKYSDEERLYVIYGNHDMVKKDEPGFYPAILPRLKRLWKSPTITLPL